MTEHTLEGRVAIVTGGGRGLGRAMVLGLASAGARVIATASREADELDPRVVVPPLLWLASIDSDRVTGRRLVANRWDLNNPASAMENFGWP